MPATTPNARYREVLRILMRRGFGFAVADRRGLFQRGEEADVAAARSARPEQLRLALEELGTAFIKLGQILSTRADLLPPEYIAELQKLQSGVRPAPTALIVARIEEQLRRPISVLFTAFDPTPLAAASIAQVHAVTLPGGTDAVVKVQRPGVREQVLLDLEIAQRLARFIEDRFRLEARYGLDVTGLADEFAWTLRNELDYLREARNAEQFQRNFAGNPDVYIPAICWEYTTPLVLTLERLRGIRMDDLAALRAAGYDPAAIAERSAQLVLQEVFEDGFFQADPHPGNLFVLDGGVIGAIDFGMIGFLDTATRANLLLLLIAIVDQDVQRMSRYLYRLGVIVGARTDTRVVTRDIQRLLEKYYGMSLEAFDAAQFIGEMTDLIRRHHLALPAELATLFKMLGMIEGLGRELDPAFNILAIAQPYGAREIARLIAPSEAFRQFRPALIDAAFLLPGVVGRLETLLRHVEDGTLLVRTIGGQGEISRRFIQDVVNRIVFSVLIAAFIVGLGLVILAIRPSGDEAWVRALIVAGFALSGLLGILFLWSLWRAGRDT